MLKRLQEALRDADEHDMVYECVDTLRSMMPDLIECVEALEFFTSIYFEPHHRELARSTLAKLGNVR